MRISRLFVDQPLALGQTIELPKDRSHYLTKVLRHREGHIVRLFNQDGTEFEGRITSASTSAAQVKLSSAIDNLSQSNLNIHLLQGIARGERMDQILQKATELGANGFDLVFADRTEVRLKGDRLDKRVRHWQGVVIAACEQSGRNFIPEIRVHGSTPLAAGTVECPLRLLADPNAKTSVKDLKIDASEAISIAIGPEGGWSEKEVDLLQLTNFQSVRCGPRIMRTETAGPAIVAALQSQFGDW